jgi:hypothetical protein
MNIIGYGQGHDTMYLKFDEELIMINFSSKKNLHWSILDSERALLSSKDDLFKKYWTVPTLEEYNNLFIPTQNPNLTNKEFLDWRSRITDVIVTGQIDITSSNFEYTFFQYYVKVGNNSELKDFPFIVKTYQGFPFPCSTYEISNMEHIKLFFSIISANGVNLLFDKQQASPTIVNELNIIKKDCFLGDTLNSNDLLYKINEFINNDSPLEDEFIREITTSKNYTTKSKERIRLPDELYKDNLFKSHLQSINVPKSEIDKVLQFIYIKEYVGAAELCAKLTNESSIHNYALKIREIYGKDKIKMWNSITQEWE